MADLLNLTDVRFGFPTRPDFLGPISLTVEPGQCWAIVGPNGAGKSTLLRLMAGLLRPDSGEVSLLGRSLGETPARQRAKHIAFLPQNVSGDLDFCARDVVLMGRFPHRSLGLFDSPKDYRITDTVMGVTQTLEFADRAMTTLSGGEAQRVHLAAALAQQPDLLLLDEPTASLDIRHQLAVFRVLAERVHERGLGVVVVLHDVNLAASFCTHALLLDEGRGVATGTPAEVITPKVLGPVYGVELTTLSMPDRPRCQWVVPVDVGRPEDPR